MDDRPDAMRDHASRLLRLAGQAGFSAGERLLLTRTAARLRAAADALDATRARMRRVREAAAAIQARADLRRG